MGSVCRIVDDKDKFMAKFKVWNRGNANGIITVEGCEYDPEMRTNRVFMKNYEIKAGESKSFFVFPCLKYPLHLWTNFLLGIFRITIHSPVPETKLQEEKVLIGLTSCFKSFAERSL